MKKLVFGVKEMKKLAILMIIITAMLIAPIGVLHAQETEPSTNVESKVVYVGWETVAHLHAVVLNNTIITEVESDHSSNVTLNIYRELNVTIVLKVIIPINITVEYPTEVKEGDNITLKLYVDVGKANLTWSIFGYINTVIKYNLTIRYETDDDGIDGGFTNDNLTENNPYRVEGYIKNNVNINGTLYLELDEPVGAGVIEEDFQGAAAKEIAEGITEFYMKTFNKTGEMTFENLSTIKSKIKQEFELAFRYNTSLALKANVQVGNETIKQLERDLDNDDNYFEIEISTKGISGKVGLNLTMVYNVSELSVVVSKLNFRADMDDIEFSEELDNAKSFLGIVKDDLKVLSNVFEESLKPEKIEKEKEEEIEEEREEEHEKEREEEEISASGLGIAQTDTLVSSAPTDYYDIVITTYVNVVKRATFLPEEIQMSQAIPIIAILASLSAALYVVIRRNSKR